jgi:hypothetical protein
MYSHLDKERYSILVAATANSSITIYSSDSLANLSSGASLLMRYLAHTK